MRLIDADREIKRYERDYLCPTPDVHDFEKRNAIIIVNALKKMETVENRPKGKWQRWNDVLECSVCGYGLMSPTVFRGAECVSIRTPCYFKHCPICGSKMENGVAYEGLWVSDNK